MMMIIMYQALVIIGSLLFMFIYKAQCQYYSRDDPEHKNPMTYCELMRSYRGMLNPNIVFTRPFSTRIEDYIVESVSEDLQYTGTWSTVRLGREISTGRKVAIKKFIKSVYAYNAMDVAILFKLKPHPNIIQLFGVMNSMSNQCKSSDLIFEWIKGDNLSVYINEQLTTEYYDPLSESQKRKIKRIVRQLLEGIAFLHENHVIHRDLKASNIMVNGKVIKIIDFGGSIDMNNKGDETAQLRNYLSAHRYKSPEMLKNEPYSYSTDIWNFGMIFLKMIVVKIPMSSETAESTLKSFKKLIVKNTRYLSQSSTLELAFDKIDDKDALDLIIKCLRWDPEDRITAKEALNHPYFENEED